MRRAGDPNTPEAIRKLFFHHPDPALLRTCYEAGPTGYDTHRLIASLGIPCEVITPSLIPKRSGVRVKTDHSDARNLARLHRAGELASVRVPTSAQKAVRDLVRAREDLKSDHRIARQRIRSFRFEVWMRALRFEEPAGLDPPAEPVARLRAFRGIDTLTAVTLAIVGGRLRQDRDVRF
ncbi:MAG: transposase [Armatimonadetes bacterium]|nr:transposase [Armatimonadota bacterium]